jgi:hypothetical protein
MDLLLAAFAIQPPIGAECSSSVNAKRLSTVLQRKPVFTLPLTSRIGNVAAFQRRQHGGCL